MPFLDDPLHNNLAVGGRPAPPPCRVPHPHSYQMEQMGECDQRGLTRRKGAPKTYRSPQPLPRWKRMSSACAWAHSSQFYLLTLREIRQECSLSAKIIQCFDDKHCLAQQQLRPLPFTVETGLAISPVAPATAMPGAAVRAEATIARPSTVPQTSRQPITTWRQAGDHREGAGAAAAAPSTPRSHFTMAVSWHQAPPPRMFAFSPSCST